MVNGYPFPNPDFIMVGKGIVVVMGEDDSVTTLDALHIAAIEDVHVRRPRK